MARARASGHEDDRSPEPSLVSAQAPAPPVDPAGYTVVARRYRPRRFEEVVGQDHVVQALRNAIRLDRVAQAYLFSGTRGVGKTSLARIFAKCLNCVKGPTETPCLTCDICRAIAVGEDIDVQEIDGASNNGVEAVRELRQNAGLRPSRARFKIYYIDEVHMLSTGAFNALLKTLEEPPEHVKFFFATTEASKIPITVLSRCQRYDLAGIAPEQILATLADICRREGVAADEEALAVVARRASGSMRDAQSLLEQLLSSAGDRLTADLVHQVLGTASDERTLDLLEAMARRDPAAALQLLDAAATAGVQPVDLLGGALEFLRDAMVLATGVDGPLLATGPRQRPRLQALVEAWPLDTVLAAMQILADTRARLRGSPFGRLLVEMALVRVSRLEDLADLSEMVARLSVLEAGKPLPPPEKKKALTADGRATPPPPEVPPQSAAAARPAAEAAPRGREPAGDPAQPVELGEVVACWTELVGKVGLSIGSKLAQVRPSAIEGPNVLVIPVSPRYNYVAEACEAPEARSRIESALRTLLGRAATLRFDRAREAPPRDGVAPDAPAATRPAPEADWRGDPLVRKVEELFEARPIRVDPSLEETDR